MIFRRFSIIVVVVLSFLFVVPVRAYFARPTFTSISSGFYLDGSNVAESFQSLGTKQTYLLMLPMDYYADQIANLSVNFRAFNGFTWYVPDDDMYYSPVVTNTDGVITLITSQIEVSTSFDDKIHEYTLCFERSLYNQIDLICNAFRVYTDDGTLFDYGYGVDYYDGSSPYITLYYLDEYFFTDASRLIYCTLSGISALSCDALVPVSGLGVFTDCSLTELGCPEGPTFDPPDGPSSLDDYVGVVLSGDGSVTPVEQSDWLSRAWSSVRSTVDRSWNVAFTWMVQKVIPGFEIDVTPLKIVADYLYFYGVYVSTVRAILPIDLLKIFVDLALWGVSMLWSMMLWNFVKKIAWGG